MATKAADYSGTPLTKKLGIKEGSRIAFLNAPAILDEVLGPLPNGVEVVPRGKDLDVIVLFATSRAEMKRRFEGALKRLADRGGLWLAWPKKASGVETDLVFEFVQKLGLDHGLVDNKTCAIDDVWSGARFVRRVTAEGSSRGMRRARGDVAANVEVVAMSPERWADLESLFGRSGADGGCWCMYWRHASAAEWSRSNNAINKRKLKALTRKTTTGLLAYIEGEPVGWCGVGPRTDFKRLERSRFLGPVDELPVWTVVCFFIKRKHRSKKVATALLRGAIEYARASGAPALEAYPVTSPDVSEASAYPGTPAMYRAAGFKQVADRDRRLVMRRELD